MLDGRCRDRQSRIHAQICAMTAEMGRSGRQDVGGPKGASAVGLTMT